MAKPYLDNLTLEGIILILPEITALHLGFRLLLGSLQRIQFWLR